MTKNTVRFLSATHKVLMILFCIGFVTGICVSQKQISYLAPVLLFSFVGFIFLFVTGLVISKLESNERAKDLKNLAGRLGWSYTKETQLPLLKQFAQSLGMSDRGMLSAGDTGNFVSGQIHGRNAAVFDQSYVSGHDENRRTVTVTLYLMEVPGADFPVFCLHEEGLTSRFLNLFEKYDIDFDTHPNFSRKYTLYGRNGDHIRRFFTPNLLNFYEQTPPFTTLAGGKFLLIYDDTMTEPDQIVTRLNFLNNLANLFLRR